MSIPYGYIYHTINLLNDDDYIGQTTRVGISGDRYFGSGLIIEQALVKYGKHNFDKRILCYCKDKKELDFMEQVYISDLRPSYNIGLGGRGVGHHSKETRERIGRAHEGAIFSQERCDRISMARLGKPLTDNHKKALVEARIKRSTYVKCVETGIIFRSAAEAAFEVSGCRKTSANISKCCKKERNIAQGYHWEYVNAS